MVSVNRKSFIAFERDRIKKGVDAAGKTIKAGVQLCPPQV